MVGDIISTGMEAAIDAMKIMCGGTWTIDQEKKIISFISNVIGHDIVKNTIYETDLGFIRPNADLYDVYTAECGKDIIVAGGHQNFFSMIPSRPDAAIMECQEPYVQYIEDIIATYLVYDHIRKNPQAEIDTAALLKCFCRSAFLRDPLTKNFFKCYFFPADFQKGIYYVNGVLHIMSIEAKKDDIILVKIEGGYVHLKVPKLRNGTSVPSPPNKTPAGRKIPPKGRPFKK